MKKTLLFVLLIIIMNYSCNSKDEDKTKDFSIELRNNLKEIRDNISVFITDKNGCYCLNKDVDSTTGLIDTFQNSIIELLTYTENNSINKYDTIKNQTEYNLTFNDLVFLPCNYAYISDNLRLKSVLGIIGQHNPKVTDNNISNIDFFNKVYPDFYNEGKFNFPAWATQNICKVGNWNVLRLFKNSFFWKYQTTENQIVTSIYNANTQIEVKVIQALSTINDSESRSTIIDPLTNPVINETIKTFFIFYFIDNNWGGEYYVTNGTKILDYLKSKLHYLDVATETICDVSMPNIADKTCFRKVLHLKCDETLKIETVGQMVNDNTQSTRIYGRDYIEFAVWEKKHPEEKFRSRYYFSNDGELNYYDTEKSIPYIFSNVNSEKFSFEARIPWSKIDFEPQINDEIGCNITIADSDKDPLLIESKLEWLNLDNEAKYLRLGNQDYKMSKNERSIKHKAVKIDGLVGEEWDLAKDQNIEFISSGEISSKKDNSAQFRLLWDYNNLYVLIKVKDQIKQAPYYITTDYAQIVNVDDNELIWQSVGKLSNKFPEYYDTITLNLKKGTYYVNYISNGEHSMEESVPSKPFYGTIIKKIKK